MLRSIALAAAVALVTETAFAQTRPATPPNIVLFLADDLTLTDTSVYANSGVSTGIATPHLAALAKEGMTFDRAYATSPTCAPSRAALLTGRTNLNSGAMFNHQQVKPDIKKWPAYFQERGYEVVAIGKVSHYNHVEQYGFDYAAHFTYHDDVCVEEAAKWLAQRKSDKPLCLLVGTNFPHVPWPKVDDAVDRAAITLPAKMIDTPRTRRARANYNAAVERADSDLGVIRDAAKQHLPSDTLFVFSADQGSQWPFAKWNLYEAGIHVPLVVAWPGRIAADKRTDAMVNWTDLLPTLLDSLGADPKTAAPDIDGRSFFPVLTGERTTHRDRIFATHSGDGNVNYYPARSVRIGNWKYIRNLDPALEYHTHIDLKSGDTGYWPSWVERAKRDAKAADLIRRYTTRPAEELYDLSTDPDEETNLAADPAHAEPLQQLRAALNEWMTAQGDKGIATDEAVRPLDAR